MLAPPIGFLTISPPALAWFPLVWSGFGLPQGGFPANARGAHARVRTHGDLWQPTAAPAAQGQPQAPTLGVKPQAHSVGG